MGGESDRTGMGLYRQTPARFRRCKTNFENMRAHGGEQVTGIYAASWGGAGASMALNEAMIAAGTRQLIRASVHDSAEPGFFLSAPCDPFLV